MRRSTAIEIRPAKPQKRTSGSRRRRTPPSKSAGRPSSIPTRLKSPSSRRTSRRCAPRSRRVRKPWPPSQPKRPRPWAQSNGKRPWPWTPSNRKRQNESARIEREAAERISAIEQEASERISPIARDASERSSDHVEAINAATEETYQRADELQGRIAAALTDQAPRADDFNWATPEADENPDPLFNSTRDYLTQIDRYKRHQGKPTSRRKRHAKARRVR